MNHKWICLAATPVFALMALLTSIDVLEMPHMHGSMEYGGSVLGGMGFMYLLMSVFHAAPWLRRSRRSHRPALQNAQNFQATASDQRASFP